MAAADSRFHVVHVVHDLERGGLQNGLANLIERMDSDKWRHSVFALARLGPALDRVQARRPDLRVRLFDKKDGTDWKLPLRLSRALRDDPPQLVRTYNWGTWLEGLVAARLARTPAIIHSEHQQPFGETGFKKTRRDVVRRFLAGRTDAIVALSRDIASGLVDDVGIDPALLRIIVNGVDCDRIEAAAIGLDRGAAREAAGVPRDAFVIGAVGRVVVEKDFGALVAALPEILKVEPRAHVVVVGEGPLKDGLGRRAETLGVKERVHLLGERDDAAALYATFDVFAAPSISEGISNTILEAMAAALPVVTTPVGGTPEIVEAGRTAVLVRPREPAALAAAIIELAKDPAKCEALGREARATARAERSLEVMAKRYDALYTEVLWRKGLVGSRRPQVAALV